MIFFFSATGNTAWTAKQLGFYTSDRLINIAKNSAEPFIAQLEPAKILDFASRSMAGVLRASSLTLSSNSRSMPPGTMSMRSALPVTR